VEQGMERELRDLGLGLKPEPLSDRFLVLGQEVNVALDVLESLLDRSLSINNPSGLEEFIDVIVEGLRRTALKGESNDPGEDHDGASNLLDQDWPISFEKSPREIAAIRSHSSADQRIQNVLITDIWGEYEVQALLKDFRRFTKAETLQQSSAMLRIGGIEIDLLHGFKLLKTAIANRSFEDDRVEVGG